MIPLDRLSYVARLPLMGPLWGQIHFVRKSNCMYSVWRAVEKLFNLIII